MLLNINTIVCEIVEKHKLNKCLRLRAAVCLFFFNFYLNEICEYAEIKHR